MRRPVGVKGVLLFFRWTMFFLPAELLLSPPFHPHSSMSDFVRSVPVGCSRFSRCCHLIIDLSSISKIEVGPGVRRSHRNSALGFVLPFAEWQLRGCRQQDRTAVPQRFVNLSAHP